MELKRYQKTAIDKLVKISKKLFEKDGPRVCVFKAPTGSGKTIMIADYLERLAEEHLPASYAFIWISGNNLHQQSRDKLEAYLDTSRYSFSYLEDIQNNELKENEIAFVNWHSLTKQDRTTGEYTNVFMRDNEGDRNLRTFIANTKERGLQIILIVDESHYHYWSPKSQELVQDVIGPKLTLEVSATPKLEPLGEDVANGDAGYVAVKFEDVVAEGIIKTEIIINKEIGKYADFGAVADEVIISASLEKQKELQELYKKQKSSINPLLLIQLPNDGEKTSVLDKTKLEFVEKYLKDKHDITTKNGKLGIWLSDQKENIEHITANDSDVGVLIFKQAIALGWDCPRAQLLVMFRDIKSTTFEIQTVGRIMRMPEAKHYDSDELNRAFVYTNLGKIEIAGDKDSQNFLYIHVAHRNQGYTALKLPSVYLSRIDYGDLTLKFRKLFVEEANKYFGITPDDLPHTARKKADIKLDLLPSELTQAVISDAVLHGVDNIEDITGTILNFKVPAEDLKYKFELFAKVMSHPYAPVRSHTKIQQALYDWFDTYLGYQDASRIEIQRFIVCSVNNQKIFHEIIEAAKNRFKVINIKEKLSKQAKRDILWDVPVIDYYNDLYETAEAKNYAMDRCYLLKLRTQPEKDFEAVLSKSKKVAWWYKNGSSKESYLAMPYKDPVSGLTRLFYPDYIVQFENGITGIYDTKSGITAESSETEAKSNVLQAYIDKNKKKLTGGIVVSKSAGLYVFNGPKYDPDPKHKDWQRVEI